MFFLDKRENYNVNFMNIKGLIMRKFFNVCLILMIDLLFVACNPSTKAPIQEDGKDPNVPPTTEFVEATEEELALMTKILQESPDKTSSEHLVYFDIKINK